jgi:hypothetical protein
MKAHLVKLTAANAKASQPSETKCPSTHVSKVARKEATAVASASSSSSSSSSSTAPCTTSICDTAPLSGIKRPNEPAEIQDDDELNVNWRWTYLERCEGKLVKCTECRQEFEDSGSHVCRHFVQLKHAKRKAKHEPPPQVNAKTPRELAAATAEAQLTKNTIETFFKKKTFFDYYMRWIVSAHLPFDTCDNEEFREMVGFLCPNTEVIDRARASSQTSDLAKKVKARVSMKYFQLLCNDI